MSVNKELVTALFPCGARSRVLRSAWDRVQRRGTVRLVVWDTRPGAKLYPPTMPDGSPLRCTGCSAPERSGFTTVNENRDFVDDVFGACVCVLAPEASVS